MESEFQMESDIAIAKRRIQEFGLNYRTKNGDGVIHMCADASSAMVHACANLHLNINHQNFDGDSALHLAVRKGRTEVVNSLLMCGADPNLRNKLGQTAVDEAKCEGIKYLLNMYKPGLPHAIMKGEFGALQRLVVKLCVNINTVIKDDKTALMLATEKATGNPQYGRCLNTLKEHRGSLELFHAVLQDDLPALQTTLNNYPDCNINKRYVESTGWTPVVYAMTYRCRDVLQALVDTGRCNLNIRVSTHLLSKETEPLYFKTLGDDCPADIWRMIRDNMNPAQDSERDQAGNTGIFRAMHCERPVDFIQELLDWKNGDCIAERNSDGLTPRDLAIQLGRDDVVQTIDNFICGQVNKEFLIKLPVLFYGEENLNIKNTKGEELHTLVRESGSPSDSQAVFNYQTLEGYGVALFTAAMTGDLKGVAKSNKGHYKDRNGYTALTRAIVCNQLKAAEILVTERPQLKAIPDNTNRYPLHLAYALPADVGEPFIQLLLENNTYDLEHRLDKDGRLPVDYKDLRDTPEIKQMLNSFGVVLPLEQEKYVPGSLETIEEQDDFQNDDKVAFLTETTLEGDQFISEE